MAFAKLVLFLVLLVVMVLGLVLRIRRGLAARRTRRAAERTALERELRELDER